MGGTCLVHLCVDCGLARLYSNVCFLDLSFLYPQPNPSQPSSSSCPAAHQLDNVTFVYIKCPQETLYIHIHIHEIYQVFLIFLTPTTITDDGNTASPTPNGPPSSPKKRTLSLSSLYSVLLKASMASYTPVCRPPASSTTQSPNMSSSYASRPRTTRPSP